MAPILQPERHAAIELRRWQAVFEHDGNKAAAWRCFRLARLWHLPIPASVLAELDRIAEAFETEVPQARTARTKRDGNVGLGFERVGRIVTEAGPGSNEPSAAIVQWERDFALDSAVGLLRFEGMSEVAAVERVAAGTTHYAWGFHFKSERVAFQTVPTPATSVDTVRRAVRRVRRLMMDRDG
jgi:hypothetical protein